MQTVNNVLKWSVALCGMTVLVLVGAVVALWLLIEMLVVLVGMSL